MISGHSAEGRFGSKQEILAALTVFWPNARMMVGSAETNVRLIDTSSRRA
jgi:hypothetical protein